MAYTQTKDGRWICYYRVRGEDGKSRVKKEYFGRGAEAQAAAKARDDELGFKKRRPRNVTLGPNMTALAKVYFENKHFNKNSRKQLRIRLDTIILPLIGDIPAVKISHMDCDKYVAKRRQDGVKSSTVRREITDIKAILSWSASRHPPLIPFNPVRDYKKPPSDDAIILPPTQKESQAILKAASPHIKRVIKLAYYIGLRPGSVELLSLTWEKVNWEAKTILIVSAHKGGPEQRQVPLHKDFIEQLRQWYKEDEKDGHIIHYNGKPIKAIKSAWKRTLERAKITRRIRPYDLRHNFITLALEDGADMKALSEIVGSRPETIMKYYQHVSKKLHRQTVEKVPPIAGDTYAQKKKMADLSTILQPTDFIW